MFETEVVRANDCYLQREVKRHNMDIFSIFINTKLNCGFSLESPHRGDSNEYQKYTIFNIKKKTNLNYLKSAAIGFFPEGPKKEFETAMVN